MNENGSNETPESEQKGVALIPHPDGMSFPNTEFLLITTKPSKNSPVKYEVFERKPILPEEITSLKWEHGMTIGGLIENGMRNVSYRAPFSDVFKKATDPENLTDDEHRKLQTTLETYTSGSRGTTKAEKSARMKADIKASVMNELGLTPEQFEKMVEKQRKKSG